MLVRCMNVAGVAGVTGVAGVAGVVGVAGEQQSMVPGTHLSVTSWSQSFTAPLTAQTGTVPVLTQR